MMFPALLRRLFGQEGAGKRLRGDIMPYGTTSETVCRGDDPRLDNARLPAGHKATHQTGGADALTPADIGAAASSVAISAGTGLTGGGNLSANRSLSVKYGNAAGTACQGNDARLSNARTPVAHKATHAADGTDALTPADIGAAASSVTISAGTGLTGGGNLSANRSLSVRFGNAAGTACQGNDARLSNARTPVAHKATHAADGADALTPADIGAAASSVTISAGTGLSGGGNLSANRSLSVRFGSTAGTVCQGNDARLSGGRTPLAHKATHAAGAADALTPADIGAAASTVAISAGTGLTGGGNLTANRSFSVKYGSTAGTACQGNDARLSNARTPAAHKATHKTGAADALTPADIGAVAPTLTISAGTGLSGGGNLSANRSFSVKYGSAAGTACQGNDARLSNARTPVAHKASHKKGAADALTPADIGAAASTVTISAGTGLSGGGNLTANRSFSVKYGSTAGTACQGNDSRLAAMARMEAFRLAMVGCPFFIAGSKLPANFRWPDRSLVLFSDWPDLKKVYDSGYLDVINTADPNYPGKWVRNNATNPTGLYLPDLGGLFSRNWRQGQTVDAGRAVGNKQGDAARIIKGGFDAFTCTPDGAFTMGTTLLPSGTDLTKPPNDRRRIKFDNSRTTPTAAENRPINVAQPVAIYLGNHA